MGDWPEPMMKLALNGATTMHADLVTDLRAAEAAGFDYIEIWAAKLRAYLGSHTVEDLAAEFDQSSVRPYSINSIEHLTFRDEDGRAKARAECADLSRVAAAIGCPYLVVVPSPLPSALLEIGPPARRVRIVDESVRALDELADIAEPFGVNLAFEFLGQPDCSVPTLGLANEIVTRAARASIGLVIDSFHFYAGGSTIEMIEETDPARISIFHINDAEDRPRETLEDKHRLLPGLGILPLKEMIAAFKRIGYDRVASVEIFRPEYWERDPYALAREAREAAAAVLQSSST